jgi:hypothetical protein
MEFLVFMGCAVIYLTEYLLQSYIACSADEGLGLDRHLHHHPAVHDKDLARDV